MNQSSRLGVEIDIQRYEDELRRMVIEIVVDKYGMTEEDTLFPEDEYDDAWMDGTTHIWLGTQHAPGQEIESSRPTVHIVAKWDDETSPQLWENVVKEVKGLVDAFTASAGLAYEFNVDIMAPELIWNKFVHPVEYIPQLKIDWPIISAKVKSILEGFKAEFSLIILTRLGYSRAAANCPITIYIALSDECPEAAWKPICTSIETYLGSIEWNLHVHIEHNQCTEYNFDLLKPRIGADFNNISYKDQYKQCVDMGDEIGAACYVQNEKGDRRSTSIGTVGCWLEVKHCGVWKKLALTSYHAIRPGIDGFVLDTKCTDGLPPKRGTNLWNADHHGIFLGTGKTIVKPMEHPTRSRHNKVVKMLENEFQNVQQNEHPSEYAVLQNIQRDRMDFFDNEKNILGNVWAASGFEGRTIQGQRLDWALIEVPTERQGCNKLPPGSAYQNMLRPSHAILDRQLQTFPGPHLEGLPHGSVAWKLGNRTGLTSGTYSEYKATLRLGGMDKYMASATNEYIFIHSLRRQISQFSDQGDSGSVLYDRDANVVGLLFRGQVPRQAKDVVPYTFVTPMADVFDDIKKITGVADVRIAQG